MVFSVIKNRICFRGNTWEDNLFPNNDNKVSSSGRKPEEPGSNWRGASSETQGQSLGLGEKARKSFQAWAEEPLGTDSHRMISKRSGECRLLIGHKKCLVLLCPIGEQFLLSSFREFVYEGYKLSNSRRVRTTTVTATKTSL